MKEYICKDDMESVLRCEITECFDCVFADTEVGCSMVRLSTVTIADIKKSILQEVWIKALGYESFGLEELDEVIEQIKENEE